MIIRGRSRRTNIVTAYVMVVVLLFLGRQLFLPASEPVESALIFISDTDSIDAGRGSNSVYRIGLDGRGLKRIVGSIPHGDGYLRTTDIDCHAASQQLVIASHRRDLNGFHHAQLDGSGLHLDKPDGGLLSATREIALATNGTGILVSRQFEGFAEPRYGLVAGSLFTRAYAIVKPPSAALSYLSPTFLPNGRKIAYIIERQESDTTKTYQLAIALPSGGSEEIVYETSLRIRDVAWSPMGQRFAFEMSGQIYRLRLSSGDVTKLTDHLGGASSPRWSPDGARISYVAASTFPGHQQLMIMNADGSNKERVTNIRGEMTNGCWV